MITGLALWFSFMNHKMKEASADMKGGDKKREEYVKKGVQQTFKEIASVQPAQSTLSSTESQELAKPLLDKVNAIKTALENVDQVERAPQHIISSMRKFRDYMIALFIYLWAIFVTALLVVSTAIEASGVVALVVAYLSLPFYFWLRRGLLPMRKKWRQRLSLLEKEGLIKVSVPE